MAKYKFSLEKVLEWRVDGEKTVAKSFALTQRELDEQHIVLNQYILEIEEIKEKIVKLNNILELKQMYLLKQIVELKIENQLVLIEKTKEDLERIRLELLEAQKNRKIMEKLKEKDYDAYKEEVIMSEQKELDEMAVLKFKKSM